MIRGHLKLPLHCLQGRSASGGFEKYGSPLTCYTDSYLQRKEDIMPIIVMF